MSKQVKLYIKPVNISKKSRRIYIMSKKVVIAGACRTAIGKMGGALSTTPASVLGSIVIKEALNRAGVPVIRLITYIWDVLSRQDLDRT